MDVELEGGKLPTLFITSLMMGGLLSQEAVVTFSSVTYLEDMDDRLAVLMNQPSEEQQDDCVR
jgi:hypothetical protein